MLYTTHYMEEAERLCDRVAIIDEGKLKAEGTEAGSGVHGGEKDRITINGGGDLASAAASVAVGRRGRQRLGGGPSARCAGDERLEHPSGDPVRVTTAGASITGVAVVEPNLEAVFLHLTGKALRD